MPGQYKRGSSVVAMAFRGRSVLSLRRNQVVSMDQVCEDELYGLDHFQSHVADHLISLIPSPNSPPTDDQKPQKQQQLLSLPFLQRLLDAFLSCEEEFRALLVGNPALVSKPPVNRLLADLVDRAVKSLDICNEITQIMQSVHHWNRHADIAASALPTQGISLGEGQLHRARRALAKLLASSADQHGTNQHEAVCSGRRTERAWSFLSRTSTKDESLSSRSLSRTWSLDKQMQALSANLVPPKGADAGCGLVLTVYTMSSLLVFSMWALVAAFSGTAGLCLTAMMPVGPPGQLMWAPAMIGMQESISEECRWRGRKGGVLAELVSVEMYGRELMEATAVCEARGGGIEVVGRAGELGEASRRLEEGLGPFERQLRGVFHRIVRSREEVIRCLEQSTKTASPFIVM